MPQPITKTQLQNLQQEIKSGGVAAVERAYIDLQSHGYAYGGWGRILAAGDSPSGRAALSYLQGTALMGMGGDQCCHLSRYENDQICIEMATQTFEIYKEIAKNNQDILDRDLNYQEVRDIHEKVFANHKLSLENWALCIPMELIREKYGEQAVENLWQQMRDTGGDGMDAAIITALLTFMEAARTSKISGVREKANLWLARFSDLSEWWDILTKT